MRIYDSRYRPRRRRARSILAKVFGACVISIFLSSFVYEFKSFSKFNVMYTIGYMDEGVDGVDRVADVMKTNVNVQEEVVKEEENGDSPTITRREILKEVNNILEKDGKEENNIKMVDNNSEEDDNNDDDIEEEDDDDIEDDDTEEDDIEDDNMNDDDEEKITRTTEAKPIFTETKQYDAPQISEELAEWQKFAAKENIGPFQRHERVAMVTKVLWPNDIPSLKQMICLFNAAYNHRVGYYDIVVFTTMPWTEEQVQDLASVAAPAKLQVVQDSPLLEDILASMTDEEVEFLKERCGCCPNNETLGWFHHCREKDYNNVANLGYSWQAEFRAYHIWKEEVLKQYRYMIWMDSDSMPTKSWDKDPIQYMVDKNAILLYDHFPFGFTNAPLLKEKLLLAYNRTVCYVAETEEGYLKAKDCADRAKISQVGGFMHITDLDFYRSKSALNFNKIVVSYKTPRFSRQWDDQLAVTAPAIMEYPERVYGMHKLGFNASIHHNGFIDGKHKNRIGFGYTKFWAGYGREHWHVGREMCNDLVTENG